MKTRAKKLIALVMALCLTVTAVPVMNVLALDGADSQTSSILIQNGSFENGLNGWQQFVAQTGQGNVDVTQNESYLSLDASSVSVQVLQRLSTLEANTSYRLKADILKNSDKPNLSLRV